MSHFNYKKIGFLLVLLILSVPLFGFFIKKEPWKLKLIGHVLPRDSKHIDSSPWGIQIGALENKYIEKASEIGVKWTRLNASWGDIEKVKGQFNWEETDKAFNTSLNEGIIPFVCLTGSNKLYSAETPKVEGIEKEIYGSSLLPPTKNNLAFKAWLAFVKEVVLRYKEKINYWEIWNEPNHLHYWGAQPDGSEYGLLVRETALVIKANHSGAKIIAGALAGLDPDFTDKFLAHGTSDLVNIITFHNYSELPEDRIYKAVEEWKVIDKYNPGIELWQGECGYPSHSNTRDYRGLSPWGINIQAKWLLRQSFTDIFFCKTTLSNYFKLVHLGGRGEMPQRNHLSSIDSILGFPIKGGSRVKSVGVNEKCILENPGFNPKPAYFAYQNLCSVFDNRYKTIKLDYKIKIVDQGNFYGIGDEDDAYPSIPLVSSFKTNTDKYFIAYWLPWHPQEIIKEGKIELKTGFVKFKDPVLIDLLNGEVYNMDVSVQNDGTVIFKNIPLADYPYVIVERSEIKIG
jgi:polysaccharide biosynthesis protein PslG